MNNLINKTISDLVISISDKLTLADVYAADAISEVSVAILAKRISMNMTQTEFGKLLGVKQGMISKWENGDYNFTLKAISDICAKLNLTFTIGIEDYVDENTTWIHENNKTTEFSFSVDEDTPDPLNLAA